MAVQKVIAQFTVPAVYSHLRQNWIYSALRVSVLEPSVNAHLVERLLNTVRR